MWDTSKCTNICVIGVSEGEARKGQKNSKIIAMTYQI